MESADMDFEKMVSVASRWRSATMSVARIVEDSRKLSLQLSRITTKGDLDNYLMRRFDISRTEARDISNTLTQRNIPVKWDVSLDEFHDEEWAALVNHL